MKKTITFFRLLPVMMLVLLLTGSGVKAWGQATLPISNVATTSGSNTMPTGFTQSGVGTYSSTSTPWKFDDTGDWVICNFNAAPGTLTFKLTNNSLSGTYAFNVLQSADGTNYTNLLSITSVTSTQTFTISTISSTTRYIKWIYTTKSAGNIGLGTIGLTEVAGTPEIALADNGTQVADAEVSQGTAAVVLHKFQLGVTSASASLTGMTCTTSGTYAAADITNLKVRYSADATLDGADATLSTFTNPGVAGTKTFPSFTNRSIAKDATGYFFVTADIAANATHNNTIAVDAITTGNLTFSSGNKTGSTTAGGAQTFKDVTAPTVTTYSPADGNTAVTVNQNLVLTFSEAVKAGTAGDIVIYNSAGAFETIPYNDSRITFSSNAVTINPNGTFAYGANYYVQVAGTAITDNVGNTYAGIANNTTWNFTTVAPSVTNVTSNNADGTYKVGDVITVTVTFNDNVVVTGTPRVLLEMGSTDRYSTYSGGTGTNTLSFTYTLQSGDNNADLDYQSTSALGLNSGTIKSADGVAASLSLPTLGSANSIAGQKAIVIDCVAPTVSSYNPTDGNTAVTTNQNLVLTFNENVKRGASGSIVIYTTGATVFETIPYDDSRIAFSSNTVTINPEGTFAYSSDYYVQTTGNPISDMYDNNYAGISIATTWNFTTECGPVGLPYSQDFTTYLPNTCWTEKTGLLEAPSTLTEANSAWAADGFANNGSTGSARLNIYGTTAKEWLITPTIDLGTTTDYQLEFDLALTTYNATTNPGTTGTDDKFAVVISTDNGATWTSANTLRIWNNSGSTDAYNNLTPAGTHVTISLADYTGWVKIGFYGESTVSNADNDLFIDNLSVVQLATCITPTVVTSSDVTAISATISWVASSSNPANGYQYEVRTSGAAGSGTTGLAISGSTAEAVLSANISGLEANTSYNVYVRSNCGGDDFSAWTVAHSFTTTQLPAATANAATSISSTGFIANWDAVVGASEYKLDVYSQTSGTNATDLFISEYIEGNSNNKYIEIFNGTGASIDLSNYKLRLYNNGGSSPDNDVMLSGTLQNNSTIVYKNSNASLTLPNGVNATNSTACAFNGDDAIALFKISSNSNVDIFGRIGNDPGTAWTSASNSTLDKTLVRKSSVLGGIATNPSGTGSTAFTTLESEWTQFDIDNVSNLGSHAFDGGTILSFSIQNLSVASTSQEVTGLTPNTTYHYRVRAVGGNSTSANSNVVSVLTLPAAPVASAASTVNALNFVANWTLQGTGADSYTLDVATDEDFNNKLEAYDNLTVTGTSQAISGLSRNTTYYYRVKSVNASGTSVSNVISVSTGNAITVTGSNESAESLADCADCDLVVNQGGHLTVNANKSFNSVTIKPGAKLTLNNGQTFAPGTFVLESNASATATFVDKRTHANKTDITATVQQHLPAASTRTWWYLASPVTGAASSVFGSSNKVGDYSETTRSYSNPFTKATTLTAGKGYVVKMTAASAANYVFENKTLNTGDISVLLTRTVTETPDNAKRGFNLVGNPYPSYIDWDYVYLEADNVRPTIWYRTLNGTSMEFHTYNAELGVGSPTTASEYIPPMQAFWVKVDTDPVSPATVSNGTLNFTNDMRSHDESVDGNPLKTPAADRQLVRLSISNGTLSDETVIATHPSASDNYDSYDSEKMANGDANRPEIFSMAGGQELVINGISPLTDSKQIALGVRPGVAGNYTINLTEWRNTGNMEVVLRDNQLGEELILTESSSYSFDTDGSTSTSRFSLLFRAKGSTTGFDRISSDLMIYASQKSIRVESASLEGNAISIFNALGQPVFSGKAQSNRLEINGLTPAVYMVKVSNQTKMVIVK